MLLFPLSDVSFGIWVSLWPCTLQHTGLGRASLRWLQSPPAAELHCTEMSHWGQCCRRCSLSDAVDVCSRSPSLWIPDITWPRRAGSCHRLRCDTSELRCCFSLVSGERGTVWRFGCVVSMGLSAVLSLSFALYLRSGGLG